MNLTELYAKADYQDEMGMLFHGDILDLIKNIEDESIDLVVTDPPYKITPRGNAGNSGGMLQKQINKSGKVFSHNDINIKDYANELYRILKSGSHCYIMTNHTNLIEMLNELTNVGFHFIKCLIWDKGNKIMGQYYMSQFEYAMRNATKQEQESVNDYTKSISEPLFTKEQLKQFYQELEKKSFKVDLGYTETDAVRLVDIEDILVNQFK